VWLFLEVGAPGAALLRGAVSRGMTPHGAYARRLLAAFEERGADLCPPSTPHREAKAVETLSRREHEVLELIGQGHSNQEIAAVLIVSINTVKKHASTIYGKLGVGSRTQAVARAQELGILERRDRTAILSRGHLYTLRGTAVPSRDDERFPAITLLGTPLSQYTPMNYPFV
jgi:DNA-binding CsgD family transcriptional regulator